MIPPFLLVLQAPPPVIDVPAVDAPTSPGERLTVWQLAEVRCGGEPVVPARVEVPLAGLDWASPDGGRATLYFRIDADRRTFGTGPSGGFGVARDLAPALAATRFSPGRPHAACYHFTRTPVAEAPMDALIGYTIFPQQWPTDAI